MTVDQKVRRRLEAQGFVGLDDAVLAPIAPWLRWSPALCTIAMTVGVILRSPVILWVLAGIALLGTVFPVHPFDLLYNYGVRHLTGTGPLPANGPQRRFACGVATIWLIFTGWAFSVGATAVGFVLGALLIAVAALVTVTHFCIPSLIYNTVVRRGGVSPESGG